MIYEQFLGGVLCHYGVKGMKWGVRRSPEQLGHEPRRKTIEKSEESATMVDGIYHSTKGFAVAQSKLAKYCLNPDKPHAKEFFEVGYKETDEAILFQHIQSGFDMNKKSESRFRESGAEQFAIPMKLGVTKQRTFTTSWQIDEPGDEPRMTSAYLDRRVKED
jgi:hypothetical protein